MIKVLHSELQYKIGGIESFLLNLTKCMDASKIHFDFLMRGNNEFLESELLKRECKVYKVPQKTNEYYMFIRDLLETGNYDYVHIHKNSAASILFPMLVKHYANAKLVIHSHNTRPSTSTVLKEVMHRINKPILNSMADIRLACSELAADWLFGSQSVKNGKVHIVKNGIIIDEFKYDKDIRTIVRKELDIKKDEFVIGHVGAFRDQKNHKFLVDILKEISTFMPKLILVGTGPLMEDIKNYSEEMGVKQKILFLGNRNDVSRLLMAIDVFVMPSLYEGFPVSCVEAQAAGLPVLLADNISRMCKITDNVIYLPIDNVNIWAKKIDEIKRDFFRRDISKEIASEGYDMMETANMLTGYYERNL